MLNYTKSTSLGWLHLFHDAPHKRQFISKIQNHSTTSNETRQWLQQESRENLFTTILKEMLVPLLNSNDREFVSSHFAFEFFQKHVKIQAFQFETTNARSYIKFWLIQKNLRDTPQYDYTASPTRYRTRHFFNNSTTNEDIATKFEQEYICCVGNEEECICSVHVSIACLVCVCSACVWSACL